MIQLVAVRASGCGHGITAQTSQPTDGREVWSQHCNISGVCRRFKHELNHGPRRSNPIGIPWILEFVARLSDGDAAAHELLMIVSPFDTNF